MDASVIGVMNNAERLALVTAEDDQDGASLVIVELANKRSPFLSGQACQAGRKG
jgi:hypothetical protein